MKGVEIWWSEEEQKIAGKIHEAPSQATGQPKLLQFTQYFNLPSNPVILLSPTSSDVTLCPHEIWLSVCVLTSEQLHQTSKG
jgi:hypothetical protein